MWWLQHSLALESYVCPQHRLSTWAQPKMIGLWEAQSVHAAPRMRQGLGKHHQEFVLLAWWRQCTMPTTAQIGWHSAVFGSSRCYYVWLSETIFQWGSASLARGGEAPCFSTIRPREQGKRGMKTNWILDTKLWDAVHKYATFTLFHLNLPSWGKNHVS